MVGGGGEGGEGEWAHNTEIHRYSVRIMAQNSVDASQRKHKNQIIHYDKQGTVLLANYTPTASQS